MEYNEFCDYVNEIIENEIPTELLEGLNLGIIVMPELKRSDEETNRTVMGLYVRNVMGKQVIIYYGSFLKLYGNSPEVVWKKKVLSTIKHELTHHIEARAGQEELARQEKQDVERRKINQVIRNRRNKK